MRTNRFLTVIVGIVAAASTPGTASGQCSEWAEKTPVTRPPARGNTFTMAYHPSNGLVLFGGSSLLGDTWAWNGSSWTKLSQSGPSARGGHQMVYDAARGEIVLFGGHDGAYRDDTWVWNGTNWTEKTGLTTKPGPRAWHAMAYDETRQVVVLFGGSNTTVGGIYLGDTWEWNGTSWTQPLVSGPSGREGHAMAFHPTNGVVLFGGGAGSPNNETWAWNGAAWTKLTGPGNQPSPERYWNAMAYDNLLRRIVLFGGGDATTILNDTYVWDGDHWCIICADSAIPSPDRRSRHAMGFDPVRHKTVIFGGYINVADALDDT